MSRHSTSLYTSRNDEGAAPMTSTGRETTPKDAGRISNPAKKTGLRGIDPAARRALLASWLGWTFDGFETYALILVGHVAVIDVGSEEQVQNMPTYVAALLAATLVGWAIGGIGAGFLADR